ncbi:hypothetical protein ACQJBY_063785 [Aegilops geniculata]
MWIRPGGPPPSTSSSPSNNWSWDVSYIRHRHRHLRVHRCRPPSFAATPARPRPPRARPRAHCELLCPLPLLAPLDPSPFSCPALRPPWMELAPRHAPGRDQLRVSRPLAASGRVCVHRLRPGRALAPLTAPALALLLLLLAVPLLLLLLPAVLPCYSNSMRCCYLLLLSVCYLLFADVALLRPLLRPGMAMAMS